MLAASGFAAAIGEPPLVDAARQQDQAAVRTLLNQKVDVNARSSDGSTALLWAAHWNDADTADLLLKAGADANRPTIFARRRYPKPAPTEAPRWCGCFSNPAQIQTRRSPPARLR